MLKTIFSWQKNFKAQKLGHFPRMPPVATGLARPQCV